jgi:hypothetical protein
MTVRDELERVLAMGREMPTLKSLSDFVEVSTTFLRDHGPALLEALEDAERYRFIRSGVRCAGLDMGGDHHYSFNHKVALVRGPSFDDAIDTARRGGE